MKFPVLLCVLAVALITVSGKRCVAFLPNRGIKSANVNAEINEAIRSDIELQGCNRSEVTELSLFGNEISYLPFGVFRGLTSLVKLSLYANQITTLPYGVFQGLTSLVRLTMSNNKITTLRSGVFQGLTSLGRLSLYDNEISYLPSGVFQGLTSLVKLDIAYNQITILPSGVFQGLTSLVNLTINGNDPSLLCKVDLNPLMPSPGSCRQISEGINVFYDFKKYESDGSYGFRVATKAPITSAPITKAPITKAPRYGSIPFLNPHGNSQQIAQSWLRTNGFPEQVLNILKDYTDGDLCALSKEDAKDLLTPKYSIRLVNLIQRQLAGTASTKAPSANEISDATCLHSTVLVTTMLLVVTHLI